ncbi:MAG: surface glycan-binding family protein [Candidatus Cryptobacteroides sp.]
MKSKIFRLIASALAVIPFLTACEGDSLKEGGFELYYSDVVEIAQNITVNLAPTWFGGTPSDFAITKVTFDGALYSGPEFSINSETGMLIIAGAKNTTPGEYVISLSCTVGNRSYSYPDKVKVTFTNGIPEGISVDPGLLVIDIANLSADSEAEIPTAQVLTEGEHIAISSYAIRNVKKEGVLVDNVTSPLFAITNDGVISAVKGGPFEIGTYTLDLKLNTRSYTNESAVGIFGDAVSIKIVAAPTSLSYTPDNGLIEEEKGSYTTSFTSAAPVLKGSVDGIQYTLATTPQTDKITIDPETGVISIAQNHGLVKGSTYDIDVLVKNDFTAEPVRFAKAYRIEVVDFIDPIENFSYSDFSKKKALGWSVLPDPALSGARSFEFTEPEAAYTKYVSLDPATGALSAEKYNTLPEGTYDIKVTARNGKEQDTRTAVLRLTITENPYFFTYFSYGNNIGLTEQQTSGVSQFRVTSASELAALSPEIISTDLKAGITATYSRAVKRQLKSTTIDSATGKITFASDGFTAQSMGVLFVTAKTADPDDQDNAFEVTMPVFVDFSGEIEGVTVKYDPFVLRVNPKVGGRSAVPVVTGTDLSTFLLDFRRSFTYDNIHGVREDGSEMESGVLNNSTYSPPFIEHLWNAYGSDNYGAKLPVSYWNGNIVKTAELLSKSPCYVDNTAGANHLSVVVPPGTWRDNGWADGTFYGQMTYTTDGVVTNVSGGKQIFPLVIWIDKDFEE